MADPFAKFYNTGTWGTLILNVVSGAALLSAAAWFSYNLFSTRDAELPPRVVNSITVEPSILLAGKPFTAHINVTLNRLCPYEVRWSLIRAGDGVEIVRIIEPIKQPPAQIGTFELPASPRYVPASVAPGEYKYASEVVDLCPEGHTYTTVRKNADVIIR
jgi:hypothetical protein